jgi:FkbM family methyltransferase
MKILPCGVAVLEGDTHHTKWIEKEGKLDIAEKLIHKYKQWIPVGGVVVDAGAMYGDHTITYAKLVGPRGRVHAFEPHPESYRCLSYNMQWYPQVTMYQKGLGRKSCSYTMICGPNIGASWLGEAEDNGSSVKVVTLDSLYLNRLDFLKLDVEGFEYMALLGAERALTDLQPAILCEINEGALQRAGVSRQDVFDVLKFYGYRWGIIDSRISEDAPQYDIFCLPVDKK